MNATSKALTVGVSSPTAGEQAVVCSADLERLPGLTTRNWAAVGAQLGLAATGGLGATLVLAAGLDGAFIAGIGAAAAAVLPAVGWGAWFGRRWQKWLIRDSGTASVGRWLCRLASDGAVAGAATAASWVGLMLLASTPPSLVAALTATGVWSAVGAAAGALTLVSVGFPYILATTQNRRTWPVLALTAAVSPAVLLGVIMALGALS